MSSELAKLLSNLAEMPEDLTLPEADIEELTAMFADYQRGADRFKVGDIVTTKNGHNSKSQGRPHIVLEVRPDAPFDFTVTDNLRLGAALFGQRAQVRLAHRVHGEIFCFWVEAYMVEPYTS